MADIVKLRERVRKLRAMAEGNANGNEAAVARSKLEKAEMDLAAAERENPKPLPPRSSKPLHVRRTGGKIDPDYARRRALHQKVKAEAIKATFWGNRIEAMPADAPLEHHMLELIMRFEMGAWQGSAERKFPESLITQWLAKGFLTSKQWNWVKRLNKEKRK